MFAARGAAASGNPVTACRQSSDLQEAVRMAVVSGKYAIVLLLDKDIMARIVRPSYKDIPRRIGCVFHQAEGCALEWEDRPYGCRLP